jgi:hypothetical protein
MPRFWPSECRRGLVFPQIYSAGVDDSSCTFITYVRHADSAAMMPVDATLYSPAARKAPTG